MPRRNTINARQNDGIIVVQPRRDCAHPGDMSVVASLKYSSYPLNSICNVVTHLLLFANVVHRRTPQKSFGIRTACITPLFHQNLYF